MKTIGLIGGMSWESSAEYYRMINRHSKTLHGGHHNAKSVLVTVDFAEIEALQRAQDWAALSNPSLAAGPPVVGTRVFFGGLHTTDTSDPNNELNDALSTDGGATWTVDPASIVAPGDQAYGSSVAAGAITAPTRDP